MTTDLNEDEILEVLKIIDESNFEELRLETDNLKLVLRKSAGASSSAAFGRANLQETPMESTKPVVSERPVRIVEGREYAALTPTPAPIEGGLVAVKAPVLGIFFRSFRPGAPPFVEEGTSVKENDTVCIIEVMKVFNTVTAGVRGVVAKVSVDNGQTVEFGQTLFLIRPDGTHEKEFGA